jgi:hypothetical protein
MKAIPIIGRDPVLTMRITMLIGERAKRNRIREKRIAMLKMPFIAIWRMINLHR